MSLYKIFSAALLCGMVTLCNAASLLPEVVQNNWIARKDWKGENRYQINENTLIIERPKQDKGAGAFFCQPFTVTAGARYQVGAEINATLDIGSFNLLIRWKNQSGKNIKSESLFSSKKSSNNDFKAQTVTVIAPAGAVKADVGVVVHNKGTVKFRNLLFEKKNNKTASEGNFLPEFTFANWTPAKSWKGHSDYLLKDGIFTIARPQNDEGAGAYFSDLFAVKSGNIYEVSADIFVEKHVNGRYNVMIYWYDEKGKNLSTKRLFYPKGVDQDFRSYKLDVTAPEGAVKAKMALVVNKTGTAKFRNLFFGNSKKKMK